MLHSYIAASRTIVNIVSVISHQWCAAHLVGIAHHSFYSAPFFFLTMYGVFFYKFLYIFLDPLPYFNWWAVSWAGRN